jgi:hypothetical protein
VRGAAVSEQEQKGLTDEHEVKGRSEEELAEVEGHMFKGPGEDSEGEADEFGMKGLKGVKGRSDDPEMKG